MFPSTCELRCFPAQLALFYAHMWVFNMLIKCLVPHRHWPLLALIWKFPEEPVPCPCCSSRAACCCLAPGPNLRVTRTELEPRLLLGPLGFLKKRLVQQKMRPEAEALTLCFSLGKTHGKNNFSVISWKNSSCTGCLAVLRITYAFIHDKMLRWFIKWETFQLDLMSFRCISLLEERQCSLK